MNRENFWSDVLRFYPKRVVVYVKTFVNLSNCNLFSLFNLGNVNAMLVFKKKKKNTSHHN